MPPEHRYSEEEIRAIFQQASEAQEAAQQTGPQGDGLTLAELQRIGAEAGIAPEFITRAATQSKTTGGPEPRRTFLGVPIGVGQVVDLPGPLSDEAWERLVVDLRVTFEAKGEVEREGSLRHWANGNLHALVEPTETGHRLRLRTTNANTQSMLTGGLFNLAFALFFVLVIASSGKPISVGFALGSFFAMIGTGMVGFSLARTRRWADEREKQMAHIAARAVALVGETTPEPLADQGTRSPAEAPATAPVLDLDALPDAADAEQKPASWRTRT